MAEPAVGRVERAVDALPDEPQPKEDMARARNRGSADILGKNKKEHNQCKVDKDGLAGEKQKYEPPAAGQDEDLTLEYFEAMLRAREAAGLGEEENLKDEPETAAIRGG